MKTLRLFLFSALLAGAVISGKTAPLDGGYAAPPATDRAGDGAAYTLVAMTRAEKEQRVVALTNRLRRDAGCGNLASRGSLVKAARGHSSKMASQRVLSHRLAGEPDLATRVERAGYTDWRLLGENIAFGYAEPAQVVNAWNNSPGHRRNMLDCRFRDIGIGLVVADGTSWWTMDLGRR